MWSSIYEASQSIWRFSSKIDTPWRQIENVIARIHFIQISDCESSGPELKTEFFTFQTIHLTFKNHWRIVTENLFVCVCVCVCNNNIPLSLTKNTLFILIVIQQHGFSKRRWKSFLQSRRSWRWCFSEPSKSWINGLHATTA